MADERFRIESLSRRLDRRSFSSGVEPLDRYFQQQAGQDERRNLTTVHVLVDILESRVAGYYTLTAAGVVRDSMPESVMRRWPDYESFGAILLGRLAIDERYRGQGLGGLLLFDALRRSLSARDILGAAVVIVDAKDESAVRFYEHHGFSPFVNDPRRLFITLAEVGRLFPNR